MPVWGTATPGLVITVAFAGQEATAVADAAGNWTAYLRALAANATPATLTVASSAGERLALTDVLVGEVWVCSGQSNMQWDLTACHATADIQAAQYPDLRLLTVPPRTARTPATTFASTGWQPCAPESAAVFSAVGYYFGRELHRRLQVPVGLINASVGGTVIEAWTSRAGLLATAPGREALEQFARDLPQLQRQHEIWRQEVARLEARILDKGNTKLAAGWAGATEPAEAAWADMELPATWQSRGHNHSGIFWFRKTVEVPAAWAGRDLGLAIGATDKSDQTFFNNELVGSVTMAERPDAWSFPRRYTVPGRLVRAGRNVIAVRVHSEKFAGGMTGRAELMQLACPAAGAAATIPLAGTWRYAIEANYGVVEFPPEPLHEDHGNAPAALFNGMIAPLQPFAIRGAIWYQGESNSYRPELYDALLPGLIRDWRRTWRQGDFPFCFVQLPNYEPQPAEHWPELREAQRRALALPHTGMAVTIDRGDPRDIHPCDKVDVGRRLAFHALHHTYGCRDVAPSGPMVRAVRRDGAALRIFFDAIDGGLVGHGATLQGFDVAGSDGRFVAATARIEDDQVVVSSPSVPEPVAVRYAWANNPVATLYNAAGLPASPFEASVTGSKA